MLQAFCRGKSRLYRRYLGHREAGEARVCEEDEITALLIGPLEYLPPGEVGRFWQALIARDVRDSSIPFPMGSIEKAAMYFWPRRGIEPDLLVELFWASGERRILLVEFKWRAPLSGADQLHRQWREFLTPDERKDAYHIFMAPDISAGLNAKSENDVWNGRLILRSWVSVLDVLRDLSSCKGSGFEVWKSQVVRFLQQLGITRFQGFVSLATPPRVHLPPVFWSPLNGFLALKIPRVPALTENSTSFVWGNSVE